MKKFLLSFLFVFCSVTLIACQSQTEGMTLLNDVSDISISKSNGYGGINDNYFLTINNEEKISGFEEIVRNTSGKSRNVDVINTKPDYDILIRYENGGTHGLHLLLGNSGEEGIIMYIGHEENGFVVSPEGTNQLRELFFH